TMCKNIGLCMDILNFESASSLLEAGTGLDYSPKYLEKILENAINLDHKFNRRFGVRREDDTLPERFQKEPLKRGPTKGSTVDIKKMVGEYYKIHEWED
ncbi:MAG: aldehyde ferredoxin oxidoreductase C-terminal domain-containing protein, partial [Candidatus Aminicenantes bacterium]|nr:aldehyde ferredoxin oxidoreductase C-terminal domain-containing protein [Candidatus Aminicenantes bacterium]